MPKFTTDHNVVIDPDKVRRFTAAETHTFEEMAEEVGLTTEQLSAVGRRMLLDVVTQRQLIEFVQVQR